MAAVSTLNADMLLAEIKRKLDAKRRELALIEEEVRVFGKKTALTVADVNNARAEMSRIVSVLMALNESIE